MNEACPYKEPKCADLVCDCPKYLAWVDVQKPGMVERIIAQQGFDTSLPAWDLMFSMQKSFAARMHKVDDLTKEEVDTWVDRYLVCIDDELREAREHLNLYGDRPPETDAQHDELCKEVIDIAHFVMDLFIVGGANANTLKHVYAQRYLHGRQLLPTEDLITVAYRQQCDGVLKYLDAVAQTDDIMLLKAMCRLADACGQVRQQISWKHWKKPNSSIDFAKLHGAFALMFHEFINLCLLTMEPEDVRSIYITKNAENIQRQAHGY